MNDVVIDIQNVSKRYRLGVIGAATFREELDHVLRRMRRGRGGARGLASFPADTGMHDTPKVREIWAVREVAFQVHRGEVMGLIGRNGAGKSTLLKILTRITEPTSGRAVLRGRVGSLLEIGTGFHPELTGQENIYLNGTILGMKTREIAAKFDEIVAFSGIGDFIDTPVKRYSSGMGVRLGFAVAAHLEPEILLIDEVLAVGDVEFQKRCLGKMESIARGGRTVLFVSHNMLAVSNLCQRCAVIDGGRLVFVGETEEAIRRYLASVRRSVDISLRDRTDRQGNGALRFTGCTIESLGGGVGGTHINSGEDVVLRLHYRSRDGKPVQRVEVAVRILGSYGEPLCHLGTNFTGEHFAEIPGSGSIECRIPRLPLQQGRYNFNIFATVAGQIADWVQEAGVLEVGSGDFFDTGNMPAAGAGSLLMDHTWKVVAETGVERN